MGAQLKERTEPLTKNTKPTCAMENLRKWVSDELYRTFGISEKHLVDYVISIGKESPVGHCCE